MTSKTVPGGRARAGVRHAACRRAYRPPPTGVPVTRPARHTAAAPTAARFRPRLPAARAPARRIAAPAGARARAGVRHAACRRAYRPPPTGVPRHPPRPPHRGRPHRGAVPPAAARGSRPSLWDRYRRGRPSRPRLLHGSAGMGGCPCRGNRPCRRHCPGGGSCPGCGGALRPKGLRSLRPTGMLPLGLHIPYPLVGRENPLGPLDRPVEALAAIRFPAAHLPRAPTARPFGRRAVARFPHLLRPLRLLPAKP